MKASLFFLMCLAAVSLGQRLRFSSFYDSWGSTLRVCTASAKQCAAQECCVRANRRHRTGNCHRYARLGMPCTRNATERINGTKLCPCYEDLVCVNGTCRNRIRILPNITSSMGQRTSPPMGTLPTIMATLPLYEPVDSNIRCLVSNRGIECNYQECCMRMRDKYNRLLLKGTCQRYASLGMPCNLFMKSNNLCPCGEDLICVNGTCKNMTEVVENIMRSMANQTILGGPLLANQTILDGPLLANQTILDGPLLGQRKRPPMPLPVNGPVDSNVRCLLSNRGTECNRRECCMETMPGNFTRLRDNRRRYGVCQRFASLGMPCSRRYYTRGNLLCPCHEDLVCVNGRCEDREILYEDDSE